MMCRNGFFARVGVTLDSPPFLDQLSHGGKYISYSARQFSKVVGMNEPLDRGNQQGSVFHCW